VNGPALGTFSISQPEIRLAGLPATTSKSPAGRNTLSKSSPARTSPVRRLTDGVDVLSQPNPDNRTDAVQALLDQLVLEPDHLALGLEYLDCEVIGGTERRALGHTTGTTRGGAPCIDDRRPLSSGIVWAGRSRMTRSALACLEPILPPKAQSPGSVDISEDHSQPPPRSASGGGLQGDQARVLLLSREFSLVSLPRVLAPSRPRRRGAAMRDCSRARGVATCQGDRRRSERPMPPNRPQKQRSASPTTAAKRSCYVER
jgi:hypothetical protein